jgi:hypothetical protein
MMSWLRNVPVKIASSLIGKGADRRSWANCFWSSNQWSQ